MLCLHTDCLSSFLFLYSLFSICALMLLSSFTLFTINARSFRVLTAAETANATAISTRRALINDCARCRPVAASYSERVVACRRHDWVGSALKRLRACASACVCVSARENLCVRERSPLGWLRERAHCEKCSECKLCARVLPHSRVQASALSFR